jgi:ribosomal protein S19E (S16A)
MAEYKPQAVKDVPAGDFIAAYAAHLKSTDKVVLLSCSFNAAERRRSRQQQWCL